MTAFTLRSATRQGSVLDLAALWATLTLTLVYLEVPIPNAPLFATALVLQAALGTVVITWLLKGVQPSLLMLLGPGLILGGALSFALFQLVGRGVVGLVTSVATGTAAVAYLARTFTEPATGLARHQTLIHLLGLSSLAMASEFEWLLIPALACFFASIVIGLSGRSTSTSKIAVSLILVGGFAWAPMFRGAWWWVITDDYNFFEVVARHITQSGPFAMWGALDVSRYHWLSYGWSGLLDYSAGSPEPLVTLTRVMPLVYALALAASLLLFGATIAQGLSGEVFYALAAWVLVANFNLDWAGTSTAGVYAILAAMIALLSVISTREDSVKKRLLIYTTFAALLALTKLPSTLTLPAIVLGVETIRFTRESTFAKRVRAGLASMLMGGLIAVVLLLPFSTVVEPLGFEWAGGAGSSDGNWLREVVRVGGSNAWIFVAIVATCLIVRRMTPALTSSGPITIALSLGVLWVVGLVMNVVIQGTAKANLHEYFSGPNYFLAGLAMFASVSLCSQLSTAPKLMKVDRIRFIALIVIALAAIVLNSEGPRLPLPSVLDRAVFRDFVFDGRLLLGLPFVLWMWARREYSLFKLRIGTLVLAIAFVVSGVGENSLTLFREGTQPMTPSSELEVMLGSDEVRTVGRWLNENTEASDLVATNFLFSDSAQQVFSDDYSLAVWSKREFLVLGPKFFGVSETAKDKISLCVRFADSPSRTDALLLGDRGVSWFVVDLASTSQRSWEPYGDVVFRTDRFWVIKLRESTN